MNQLSLRKPGRENGAVLIISLVILLVLTLIVLGSSSNAILQENMTGSMRRSSQLFQVAESALREAETRVSEIDDLSIVGVETGVFDTGVAPSDYFSGDTWESNSSVLAQEIIPGINARYFIELIGERQLDVVANEVQVNNSYGQVEAIVSTVIFRIVVRANLNDTNFSKVVSSYYTVTL